MWFRTIFRRRPGPGHQSTERSVVQPGRQELPLFDEAFLRRLERMSLQAQRSLRGNPASGEHVSRHRVPASAFVDHRPYTSGDDLRYVDWNAYARHNHVLLKLGEAEQDVTVHLLVDISPSMATGGSSRLRQAQELAAALGYLALAHSDRLRLTPVGSAGPRPFGPAQGKARLFELLRYIEGLRPAGGGPAGLAAALQRLARGFPQGGVLVLISDMLTADDLGAALRPFAPPRWQSLVLHLIDREQLQPGLSGPLELEDSETGERLALTLDAETLEAYRQALAAWREGLQRACAARGATYAPLMSDWPLERRVVPYLRARRLLD